MAYSGTLCTEAEIALMAGENVDATGATEANNNFLVAQAEAILAVIGRYDWVTNYATLNSATKQMLAEYCSRYAAIQLIAYNMSGYSSRIEAEDMINIHFARLEFINRIMNSDKNIVADMK